MKSTSAPMTVSEAARVIGVSVQTIREWADTGRLASVRTAGGWRLIEPDDVQRKKAERDAKRAVA